MKKTLIIVFIFTINLTFGQIDSLIYQNEDGLTIYNSKAFYKAKEIYNSKKDKAEFFAKNEEIDGCSVIVDIYRNPLSLTDKYFSYEYYFGSEATCGKYGNDIEVETINLHTYKKISLSDLFTEKSIVKALKNDNWVLKLVNELSLTKELDSVNSFNEMLEFLNNLGYDYDIKFHKSGFCLVSEKMTGGKIGIRLIGSQPLSVSYHRIPLQLGLMLVPKPDFKDKLLNKTEFVLGKFKNGLTK